MQPDIKADLSALADLISRGASFFPVVVDLVDGKCEKRPARRGWQLCPLGDIDDAAKLDGHAAYGFHPETIGAVVLDLDCKPGGDDGEAVLRGQVRGDASWLDAPAVFVDSPNGRHLYFRRAGLDGRLLVSRNRVLPGVDLRGDYRGGWLVAPGSVGWSLRREAWTRYVLSGDMGRLPEMPRELQDILVASLGVAQEPAVRAAAGAAPKKGGDLFGMARAVQSDPAFFGEAVQRLAPQARRQGDGYVTGDIHGNPGASTKWTPAKGIIKDFADPDGKATDLIGWIAAEERIPPAAAAERVLEMAGIEPPAMESRLESMRAAEASARLELGVARVYPLSDSGNAERLRDTLGGAFRFNSDSQCWLSWTGHHWGRDRDNTVLARSKDVCRGIAREALGMGANKAGAKLADFALRSESQRGRKAMVDLLSVEDGISVHESDLDRDPDTLNTMSGMVSLRDGSTRPSAMEDLCSVVAPYGVEFQRPHRFTDFLWATCVADEDLYNWLHIYLGYCLTGNTAAQVFPIWWGAGQNGKSVLLEVVSSIMGGYCRKAPISTWLSNHSDGPRDDLAALSQARLVYSSEPDAGRTLSLSTIKDVTGGESVACRHLYGRMFEYRPRYKTIFTTNHRPKVKSQDKGTWRRLKFVPFLYTVPEDARVPDFAKVLLAEEGPEILGWLVEGAMEYYAAGCELPKCKTIEASTKDYLDDEDPLSAFFLEQCVLGSSQSCLLADAYRRYAQWSERTGTKAVPRGVFQKLLAEHGLVSGRGECPTVSGMRLKPESGFSE